MEVLLRFYGYSSLVYIEDTVSQQTDVLVLWPYNLSTSSSEMFPGPAMYGSHWGCVSWGWVSSHLLYQTDKRCCAEKVCSLYSGDCAIEAHKEGDDNGQSSSTWRGNKWHFAASVSPSAQGDD